MKEKINKENQNKTKIQVFSVLPELHGNQRTSNNNKFLTVTPF